MLCEWVLNQEASQLHVLDVCFDTPNVLECSLQANQGQRRIQGFFCFEVTTWSFQGPGFL